MTMWNKYDSDKIRYFNVLRELNIDNYMLHLHGKYESLHLPQLKVYCQCSNDVSVICERADFRPRPV